MLPVGITIEDFIVADMEVFDDFKPTCPEKAKLQRWWSLPPHIEDGRGCGRGDGAQETKQSTAPKKGSGRPGFGTDEVSCKQTPPCSAARRTGRQACRLAGSKAGRGKFGFTE